MTRPRDDGGSSSHSEKMSADSEAHSLSAFSWWEYNIPVGGFIGERVGVRPEVFVKVF
jgi:hypothetical protein